jgi:hypothetical protein
VDTVARSPLAFEAWASGFAALLPKRDPRRYRSNPGLSDEGSNSVNVNA